MTSLVDNFEVNCETRLFLSDGSSLPIPFLVYLWSDEQCSRARDGKLSVGVMELPALKLYGKIYGRNYSVITEKSECGKLRFYATIESRYGTNRFTVTVRKRNGNFSMTPTAQLKMG